MLNYLNTIGRRSIRISPGEVTIDIYRKLMKSGLACH